MSGAPAPDQNRAAQSWLHEAVLPVYDAMQAAPARGLTPEQVVAALRAHHARHLAQAASGPLDAGPAL